MHPAFLKSSVNIVLTELHKKLHGINEIAPRLPVSLYTKKKHIKCDFYYLNKLFNFNRTFFVSVSRVLKSVIVGLENLLEPASFWLCRVISTTKHELLKSWVCKPKATKENRGQGTQDENTVLKTLWICDFKKPEHVCGGLKYFKRGVICVITWTELYIHTVSAWLDLCRSAHGRKKKRYLMILDNDTS